MSGYRAQPLVGADGRALAATTITPEQLAAAVEAADERTRRAIAERKQAEADAKAERERIQAERGARELEADRVKARTAWLGSGGDVAGFERHWPEMKAELLKRRALEGMGEFERTVEQAKAELRASGRYEKL